MLQASQKIIQDEIIKTRKQILLTLTPWIIASVFSFFQFFLQTASGILGPEWAQDFHLDKIGLGNLSAAFFYTYVLMQIPAGILYDRFQPRIILSVAALTLTCGCFLLAYTHNFYVAFIARLLMGAGSSCGFVGLLQVSAASFSPKRFALMIGIAEGSAMFGVTFGVILLSWLIKNYSWRISLFGSGIITLILMFAVLLFIPNRELDSPQSLSLRTLAMRIKIIFLDKQIMLASIFGFFLFALVNAFTSLWGLSFLINTYSFNQQLAAKLIAIIFIGITIGGPLSGWLTKLMHQSRVVLILGAACATVTMSIIIFVPNIPTFLLFILCVLVGMFCATYIQCFTVIKNYVHPSIRATAMATSNMIIMIGAPILQIMIGCLLQNHFFGIANTAASTYRLSLSILPIGMLIAFILSFWIIEPKKQIHT